MSKLIENQNGDAESAVQSGTGRFHLQVSGSFTSGRVLMLAELEPGAGMSPVYETTGVGICAIDLPAGTRYKIQIIGIEGTVTVVTVTS